MNALTQAEFSFDQLQDVDDAESFFEILDVTYDPQVLIHKRIHLLRLFQQQLAEYGDEPNYEESQIALKKAYCKIQAGQLAEFAQRGCHSCTKCEDS